MKTYADITKTIGRTPIIQLKKIGKNLPGEIYLKLEFFNPLSSVKDRIGLAMIEDGEASGRLKAGMTVLEPTSGNTGVALAFVCAAKGYPLCLVMPETMSMERRTLLLLLGAKLILTPGPLGMRGAVAKAMEIAESSSNYFLTRQFDNPANPAIHVKTTAQEIWDDMDGKLDYFIAGVGTGGTITGVGQVLKSKNPRIQVIAVEPSESPVLSGGKAGPHKIQGIGAGFVPSILDKKVIDAIEQVSSEESLAMARKLIQEEGVPVGISSGAALTAALRVASRPEAQGKKILAVMASGTERYLSTLLAEKERAEAAALTAQPGSEDFLKRV